MKNLCNVSLWTLSWFVYKFPQSSSVAHHQSRSPNPYPTPTPHPTPVQPINTSQSPVTDGCRGQQGPWGGWLRLDRGTGVFGIVVTWPVCLSVCRWMSSMWPCGLQSPPPTLYSPKVRALIAGQEARMEGFCGHPRPNPLLSTPSHLLWKSAALSCGGGNGQSKHRAQGGTNEPGQCGTKINLCLLTPNIFDLFDLLKACINLFIWFFAEVIYCFKVYQGCRSLVLTDTFVFGSTMTKRFGTDIHCPQSMNLSSSTTSRWTFLAFSEMSSQILDGLLWNSVQIYMIPRRWILQQLTWPLIYATMMCIGFY